MTVHGAKGLEFPYVFVVGAEENIFPSYMSMDDGEKGLEEERRLCYVAMTRAMERLYILFAQGRLMYGQVKFNGPSRFINEMPPKYYVWKKLGNNNSNDSYESSDTSDWSDSDFNQDTYDGENYIFESEDAVKYDSNWRIKTFDSFRKKVTNVAEDYTGGFDQDEILINDPIIMDILDENGEHDPISGVLVNFSAIIPTNINRKELN